MLDHLGIMLAVVGIIALLGAAWLFATAWLPFKLMEWWEERALRRELAGTDEPPDQDSD